MTMRAGLTVLLLGLALYAADYRAEFLPPETQTLHGITFTLSVQAEEDVLRVTAQVRNDSAVRTGYGGKHKDILHPGKRIRTEAVEVLHVPVFQRDADTGQHFAGFYAQLPVCPRMGCGNPS